MMRQSMFDDQATAAERVTQALALGRLPEAPRMMPTQLLERPQGRLAAWIAMLTAGFGVART
ncbi:hypothetical protein OU426_05275 [Frigidibacter sp. RF13]|uniref:hypothetical protein n=1 Tax=Frigidibacter sp. RF13 TaxID=2997340 RepID=UPI0022702A92|nr:hypothetical protein [Frigidibacter sp. RF13]MCY1126260.1 hypothetical protein [Frigidibacter sp. RF13]